MGQVADAAADGRVRGFSAVLTSFVGRADDVAEVAELLGEFRLVTVTGPGGMGKTRLAGEVVRRVAGRFADGVWLWSWPACRIRRWRLLRSAWRWEWVRRRGCR
jgi:hypothetical protein